MNFILKKRIGAFIPPLVLIAFILSGCRPGISLYSEQAYQQAVILKTTSLRLMDKATEPFEEYADEVDALLFEMEMAFEYANGRPGNEITVRQWEILKDPERNLLGGFLARWEHEQTLSPAFTLEAKNLISDAFDTIIGLESGKIRRSEVQ